jgi:hypothetical protein
MSVQGAGFTGGMNRFFPAVDAPYGMPLKTLMPSVTVPRTRPADVVATTLAVSADAIFSHGLACAAAMNTAVCLMKVLRLVVLAMRSSWFPDVVQTFGAAVEQA